MSLNKPYRTIAELPATLPVFPLEGVILLPMSRLPLNIFEPRYIAMADDALRGHRLIGIIQPSVTEAPTQQIPKLESVGCVGRITQFGETGDGRYGLTLTGVARFQIVQELESITPYRQCGVSYEVFANDLSPGTAASPGRAQLLETLKMFEESRGLQIDWSSIEEAPDLMLVDALSMNMQFNPKEKQALLEATSADMRAEILAAFAELELAEKSGVPTRLQ